MLKKFRGIKKLFQSLINRNNSVKITHIASSLRKEGGSMAHYFIVKKSKEEGKQYGPQDCYCGPTCRSAGVEPGLLYDDFDHADSDASALSLKNHAGFLVVEMEIQVVGTYKRGQRIE